MDSQEDNGRVPLAPGYSGFAPSPDGLGHSASIPRAIVEQVLSMGPAEWGATAELNDAGHIAHLTETLRITRETFGFDDVPIPMHGVYLAGTETVLCHTGTSPNSGPNAQALTVVWNWLHEQCAQGIAARSDETADAGSAEGKSPVAESDAPKGDPDHA